MITTYPGRVGLQQRVVPSYRAAFFDALAAACAGGLSVFAGKPLPIEGIDPVDRLQVASLVQARNRSFSEPGSPFFMCWQDNFLEWLESWQPEVLIVEANPRYLTTPKAIDWMHHRGRKVIGWGLGAPPLAGFLADFRRWERTRLLHSLDAIIAYSRQGAEQYRMLGFPHERVYVASNAVNPAPARIPTQKPEITPGKPSLLFVGRLQARKRVDLLLQACAALPAELQPQLVIIGDGPARQELLDLASRVYPQAEFPGAKHGADLEPYYAAADLFVLPGTGGLAIQQAMAHALPVIVARGDGTQEDLVRSDNGWLVPQDDLRALTATLHTALSDLTLLRKMGQASLRVVTEEINVEKMVEVFIGALMELQ